MHGPGDERPVRRSNARLLPVLSCAALLAGCDTIVMRPFGYVASQQAQLVVIATVLMLLIIVPVIALTLLFAWRYRESNKSAVYMPDWDHSIALELVIWSAPLLIIILLGAVTWISTHTLDPYRALNRIDAKRPIAANQEPLTVEVVALDWKWLFIYPEQNIAVVNELAAPVDTPIHFKITASSVMNAFYVPALAGMIYAMPSMATSLHAVINKSGTYEGFSANYSGAGFSDMRFKFMGLAPAEFERWIAQARGAGGELTRDAYLDLEKPSEKAPVRRYRGVTPDLFDAVVNRCVKQGTVCIRDMMAMDHARQVIAALGGRDLAAFDAIAAASVCRVDVGLARTLLAAKRTDGGLDSILLASSDRD
jgi:cytochrome o ubiquinol oxidase subunit 2